MLKFQYMSLTGAEFNILSKHHKTDNLYKFVNKINGDYFCDGVIYKIGEKTKNVKITFIDIMNKDHRWDEFSHICEVEIPDDAEIFIFEYKFVTDKIILKNPIREKKFKIQNIDPIETIKNNHKLFKYIEQTPELCLSSVKINGMILQYVKKQTPDICMYAVQNNPNALLYVKKQTPEICMAAIVQPETRYRYNISLKYIKNKTPEICMTAVKTNGLSLEYVENQTYDICMAAVKNNPGALKYVKNQTPTICMTAVKISPFALENVKNKTPQLYYIAHMKGYVCMIPRKILPKVKMVAKQILLAKIFYLQISNGK